uniref:Zinc finger, AN1-type domain 4 n=1 Tax=Mus musculus TaxID=10090 RepID=A0A1Y7VMG5_MOUSE
MFKADLGRIGIQLHTTYSRRIRKVKVMDNRKEPPFFNEDNVGPFYFKLPFYDTMELFIETLTGTCFELRVSPFEAVISVKGKIQRLEVVLCIICIQMRMKKLSLLLLGNRSLKTL